MPRILIVDDIAENRYLLRVLLTGYGYQVDEALDGAAALDRARATPPDLMITDLLMPVLDGFALCKAWRTDSTLAEIPIVIYTATYTDSRDEEAALSAGADVFLVKPTEPERLVEVVRDTLRQRTAGTLRRREPNGEPPEVFLRLYNSALIRKLEDKLEQLDTTNVRLTDAEAFLRAVVDSMPAHVIVLSESGHIVSVNQPHAHFAGRSDGNHWLEQLREGTNYLDLCRRLLDPSRGESQRVIRGVSDVLGGRAQALTDEFAVRSVDGTRWFAVTACPLKAHTGRVVLTHVDVTEKQDLEFLILEVTDREQHRLGMDLHDGLGQELTGLALMLAGLAKRMTDNDAAFAAELTRLSALASESVATARAIAHGLSPIGDQEDGFEMALGKLAVSASERFAVDVSASMSEIDAASLPRNTAYHLYRIAQEGITNAVRHGGATKVTVEVRPAAGRLLLRIVDNGSGLGEIVRRQGDGLSIMRYRAKTLGGSFDIQPLPAGGVEIRCVCPLLRE